MNHDYAHCLDYTDDCPKECFRGELVRDLKEIPYPLPVSWMHLKDTEECMKSRIMNDLKPCPFCGGMAHIAYNAKRKIYGKDEYRTGVAIYCGICEARMFYVSEKLAIEAWNRRANNG